jgi:hypothetical protein
MSTKEAQEAIVANMKKWQKNRERLGLFDRTDHRANRESDRALGDGDHPA